MEAILRPLVESAGYKVVAAGSAESEGASIVIAAAEDEAPPQASGARLIRVRATTEGDGDSVHRYDRDGLLAALAGESAPNRRRRRG
jgi:hypothetical protein